MKKLSLILTILMASASFTFAQQADSVNVDFPLQWNEKVHDFGKKTLSEYITIFSFKNIGDKPVTIKSVMGSSGSITNSYTKGEIKPGETGEVKIRYTPLDDSKFTKGISVSTDASAVATKLIVKGGY